MQKTTVNSNQALAGFRVVGVGLTVKCPETGELMKLATCEFNMRVKKLWKCRGCQEAA